MPYGVLNLVQLIVGIYGFFVSILENSKMLHSEFPMISFRRCDIFGDVPTISETRF